MLHETILKNTSLFKTCSKISQILLKVLPDSKSDSKLRKDFLYLISICVFSNFKKIFLKINSKL